MLITNNTRKTKKRICAIDADAPAMPLNPKTAAMIAMTKNVSAKPSMLYLSILSHMLLRIHTIFEVNPPVKLNGIYPAETKGNEMKS